MRRLFRLKNRKILAGPYLFWAMSFIIIPLLMILYYGLTDKNGSFTLNNLSQMTTPENLKALGLALLLSFISTLICLVLAYPLAMILAEKNMNQTSFIVLIFILPMWMNFLLRTLAWQTLLEKNGVINSILNFLHLPEQSIINTPSAIVLGMVYNFLPFMVLPIYNVLSKIDKDVIHAARDLGANTQLEVGTQDHAVGIAERTQRFVDGFLLQRDEQRRAAGFQVRRQFVHKAVADAEIAHLAGRRAEPGPRDNAEQRVEEQESDQRAPHAADQRAVLGEGANAKNPIRNIMVLNTNTNTVTGVWKTSLTNSAIPVVPPVISPLGRINIAIPNA